MRKLVVLAIALMCLVPTAPAYAISIAVFGDNATDNWINTAFGAGSATLVTDAQLATAGFLDAFDAVFITRNGASFGVGLSAGAAANVSAYASGNVVLFPNDFADALPGSFTPNANVGLLVQNAVGWAASGGHGYIGEFNGAAMAMSANSNGFIPLGLVSGTAGPLSCCPQEGPYHLTPDGVGHPVTAGAVFPFNAADVEFGTVVVLSGLDSSLVLARVPTPTGIPGIVAQQAPEPTSLLLFGAGLAGLAARRKRT